jgi:hypothetical protein
MIPTIIAPILTGIELNDDGIILTMLNINHAIPAIKIANPKSNFLFFMTKTSFSYLYPRVFRFFILNSLRSEPGFTPVTFSKVSAVIIPFT